MNHFLARETTKVSGDGARVPGGHGGTDATSASDYRSVRVAETGRLQPWAAFKPAVAQKNANSKMAQALASGDMDQDLRLAPLV